MTIRSIAIRMLGAIALGLCVANPALAEDLPGVSPQHLAAAKAAFDEGAMIAIGVRQTDDKIMSMVKEYIASDPEHKIQSGKFKAAEAVEEWKQAMIVNPISLTSEAYRSAHGRDPTPEEELYWRPRVVAGNAWFAIIRIAERMKLKQDPFLRRQMIERAHLELFGRVETDAERAYWLSRDDDFAELLAAARNWMYTPKGAQDLKASVTRALLVTYLSVSDDDIATSLALAKKNHWTFKQMAEYPHKRH